MASHTASTITVAIPSKSTATELDTTTPGTSAIPDVVESISKNSQSGPNPTLTTDPSPSIPVIDPRNSNGAKEGKQSEEESAETQEIEKINNDDEEDEQTAIGAAGTGAVVDMEVFGQLLEIDDDESHEFSKTLAFDYISQAETTFEEIEEALDARDLETLSRKGHFLKGSSAALGLQRVQHSCESMQHFGNRQDEFGEGEQLSEGEALKKCRKLLTRMREEQEEAKSWLEGFYRA